MAGHRYGNFIVPSRELLPKQSGICQEEGVRVYIDGLFDVIW
jgi:hypothetical protein